MFRYALFLRIPYPNQIKYCGIWYHYMFFWISIWEWFQTIGLKNWRYYNAHLTKKGGFISEVAFQFSFDCVLTRYVFHRFWYYMHSTKSSMKRLICQNNNCLQKRFCSIVHRHYTYDIKLKRTQFSIEEPLEEKKINA